MLERMAHAIFFFSMSIQLFSLFNVLLVVVQPFILNKIWVFSACFYQSQSYSLSSAAWTRAKSVWDKCAICRGSYFFTQKRKAFVGCVGSRTNKNYYASLFNYELLFTKSRALWKRLPTKKKRKEKASAKNERALLHWCWFLFLCVFYACFVIVFYSLFDFFACLFFCLFVCLFSIDLLIFYILFFTRDIQALAKSEA